jgi:murein L,D-transpeptidase YafK
LNPNSNFYLSLGLNYPNLSDQRQSKAEQLGGDIFIHGSCITIGCLPMTDSYIKEIYLLAVHARNNGQTKIPVYIFPFQMTGQKFANYKVKFKDNEALIAFWGNLKTGYDKFTKDLQALNIQVSSSGLDKY